ncbi:head scaffolding protein [Thiohalocapsa phage LS06-2018-MD04]|jgi:hypothetical protein|nr:head scaffolding protein [Thiohalocapsa phage LS06-2018-MD04]
MADAAQDTPSGSDMDLMQSFAESHGLPPEIGENEPRAPQAKAQPQTQEQPETPEALREPEIEEGNDLDYETLAKLGLVPEEQPASGDGDGDGTQDSSNIDLSLLAKTLGIESSDLLMQNGELMVRTKVDGETATVPFAELRKGYQLQKHLTRQQQQFADQRKAWEQQRQLQEHQLQQQANMAQEILNHEERQLNEQYTRDWKALRQEDPAEYAAQVAEYNQRLTDIRRRKAGVEQALQQRQQEQMQQYQQQMQQRVQMEMQQFVEKTGWVKPEEFQANTTRLRGYLIDKAGFQPQEVDSAADHRALLIAEKARKYDELMSTVQTAKKKVGGSPTMPSGRAAKLPTGKRSQTKQAQQRLARTGSLDDAASVINSLGIL